MNTHRLIAPFEQHRELLRDYRATVITQEADQLKRHALAIRALNRGDAEDLAFDRFAGHDVRLLKVWPLHAPVGPATFERVDTARPLTVTRWQRLQRWLRAVATWFNQPQKGLFK